ncbi:hypothetical protein AQUCO_02200299v1 [Aquilegia coerulea]|uniref:Uncharacterized protein n=1 Tax=Aquilegia coerulea TaxID=218851 RepID=A0A2G5DE10_AQUCA|nr:hypothetical protein AQUCO_02200299v1 [Aquilegia coerulea]
MEVVALCNYMSSVRNKKPGDIYGWTILIGQGCTLAVHVKATIWSCLNMDSSVMELRRDPTFADLMTGWADRP